MMHSCRRPFLLLLSAWLAAGCASVKVNKVPTPTQYRTWDDDMQQRADSMEGVRFYLPRPFVNVYQSFPIATDIYLADGVVSPDGQYVIIQNVRSESPLGRVFVSPDQNGVQKGVTVPNQSIGAADPKALEALRNLAGPTSKASPHSGDLTNGTSAASMAKSAADQAAASASAARMAAEDALKPSAREAVTDTGKNRRKVTNDNSAFAYQPLRGSMDIVYLPDFEEQYVVRSKSGLGNAEFTLAMGQGWSLQGLDSFSDNSRLNQLIYELIGTAADAAKAFATSGTSLGVDAIASTVTKLAQPHAGGLNAKDTPGTPVTLRIVIVYYAAKGIYPVIKPRELKDQPQSTFLISMVDSSRVGAAIRSINDPALQRELAAADAQQPRFSKPVYPFQYVSFNTFRYMSVDVLTKHGLPIGALYPDQGTVVHPQAPATPPPVERATSPANGSGGQAVAKALQGIELAVQKAAADAVRADATLTDLNLTGPDISLEDATDANTGARLVKLTALLRTVPTGEKETKLKNLLTQVLTTKLNDGGVDSIRNAQVDVVLKPKAN